MTDALGPCGVFAGDGPAPFAEPHRLGCLAVGALAPRTWRGEGAPADFFALKGVAGGARGAARRRPHLRAGRRALPAPGPGGRGAGRRRAAGWIGELHPLVCREWDLEAAAGFELDLAPLIAAASAGEETFEDVTDLPRRPPGPRRRGRRPRSPPPGCAPRCSRGGGELLRSADVFDLYEGEQLGEGRKSLALRLEFRAADRTLTDEEVAELRGRIAAELEGIGGSLRE